jgi:hypothetical protein
MPVRRECPPAARSRHAAVTEGPEDEPMQRLTAALTAATILLATCAGPGGSAPPGTGPASTAPAPTGSPSDTASPADTASPTTAAGVAWRQLSVPAGPEAREDHTWTLAPQERAAYLFGGRDGSTVFDDLWRYDLATNAWSRLQPSGPGPAARFGHTGSWVDGVGLVVWSGQAGSSFFADLWAYDPQANAWRELPAAGAKPAPRYGSCGAVGPDGRLWISHGFTNDGRFSDTRAYDFGAERWADETPSGTVPVKRCLHDCLWTPDGRFVLYAGQTNGVPALGDLWTREATGAWAEQAAPEPPARQLYALAALDGQAWVFGGSALDGAKLSDLWRLDLTTVAWSAVEASGDAPAGRSGATLVADGQGGRLLLFGGRTKEGGLADTWELTIGG